MAKKVLIISTSLRGNSNSEILASENEVVNLLSNGDVSIRLTL